MSNLKNEFLDWYGREALEPISLPEEIARLYNIESCLKYSHDKNTYLLRSKTDGVLYILKQASRFLKAGLQDEYDILSGLDNKAFPKVLAYLEEGEYAWILREYIPGNTLNDVIERHGMVSADEAAEAAITICRNLSYLHQQTPPIIHRDIKPENIILTPNGDYAIIDMGIARRYKRGVAQDTLFMGTQATAAPEQYGFGQTDARSDVYAMGVLLLFMLTGDYDKSDKALQTINPLMRHIIAKCIALDPKKRYANAKALKAKLIRFQKRRIHRITAGIAVGICAAALAAIFCLANVSADREAALTVHIDSPLIEEAVRLELDKAEGEPILRAELDQVDQIIICGDTAIDDPDRYAQYCDLYYIDGERTDVRGDIDNLEDLRQFKNLKTLVLDRQNISDISALAGLPLQSLELSSNQVMDLSPLKQCTGLIKLSINDNPVKEAGLLSKLEKLEVLDISFTDITDISAIANLPIRELYMFETPVRDHSPLKKLKALETLATRYLSKDGFKVVSTLTTLKSLSIFTSGIKSFDGLKSLVNLEELNLNANAITDLSDLANFPELRNLNISDNPVKSFEPLKQLPLLTLVEITHSDIPDLTVFLELPRIREVRCDQKQERTFNNMGIELPFEVVVG